MDVVTKVNTKTGLDRFETVPIGADAENVTMKNGISLQTAGQNIENWHSEVANVIDQQATQFSAKMDDLNTKIDDVVEKTDDVSTAIDKVADNIRETTETTLVGAIDNLTSKIDISNDIRQQVAANTSNISALNTTVGSHTTSIGDLSATVASHTSSIGDLNITVGSHTDSIGNLNITVGSHTDSIGNLNTAVSGHTEQLGSEDISEVGTSVTNAINQLNHNYGKCLIVDFGALSGEEGSITTTRYSSQITEDMVVVSSHLSNPSAQTGDWTWTTAEGSVTVSGSISGETTLKFVLAPSVIADVASSINQG